MHLKNSFIVEPQKLAASFAAAVLLVALVATVSVWAFGQIAVVADARRHSDELIGRANGLLLSLVNAETSQRGYSLTGDEAFLEPYYKVRDKVPDKLKELRKISIEEADDVSRKHLQTLQPLVEGKMKELEEVINIRREQGMELAVDRIKQGSGKLLMDQIRVETEGFIQLQKHELAEQETGFQANMGRLLSIIVTASLLTLLLALACVYLVYRAAWVRLRNLLQNEERRSAEAVVQKQVDEVNARNSQATSATELRYRRLFETAQDGILILDAATGQVVDANPFLKDLLGYSQEEFLGRKLWEIGPFKGEDASKSAFAGLQVTDRLHYEGFPLEAKDGRRVEVEFISNAYMVDDTRLIQCNIRDITERMRVNQALATANKELAFQVEEKGRRADELALINEERLAASAELAYEVGEKGKRAEELAVINAELTRSNAELEQFAYVATHDLQEPLRAVASCVQLLQKRYGGQLDDRADEFITHAVDGTKRMQTLINDLLAYSRITTHARVFASTKCEEVLQSALANLMVAVAESGAEVTHDPLPTVSGDETQLTQLFQNLIGNALKFRGERTPQIHISAVLQEGEWVFSVADNGIGMEPQYFERVFMVFQRLHTRKEYQGTGIGLAICKKVVERHGGRIWAQSPDGPGAMFCFTIPERK